MTLPNLIALLPMIILGAGTALVMLVIAFYRSHFLTAVLTLLVLLLALIAIPFIAPQAPGQVTPLLVMDSYSYFISGLVIASSVVVALLAYGYLKVHRGRTEEFYLLLLSATLGSVVLASSSHFAAFFLGLEILSISLYAMIGYSYDSAVSVEAAVKYIILASSSAAFLLFGMAMVYNQLGTMEFARIAAGIAAPAGNSLFLVTGLVMIIVGIGYKLALVPFHLWTPDVYEGAPAPVTAFIATISKGSMFAVLLRLFGGLNTGANHTLFLVFIIIAIVTMLAGSLLALLQNNLKRLLAYSSIANLGYLLVAFLAGGANAMTASTFYLVAYFVTILAAFGVVAVLSSGSRDAGQLEDYRGLMWRRPWLAAILAASMFSLAGIPLTVGFVGKFYLVLAGVGSALWLLVVVLVISSAISLFYYLRVVVMLFAPRAEKPAVETGAPAYSLGGGIALAALFVLLIWLGVYPSPLIQVIQALTITGR